MKTSLDQTGLAVYNLLIEGDKSSEFNEIDLNKLLGARISLDFAGEINCISCNRSIKKTFNQGYCYPCFQSLAECDICIVKPELCHYDRGTCRDEEFAGRYCNIPHSVYVSLTSSVKVGITRANNEIHRWIDQGAVKAQRIMLVKRRKLAGLIEVELAKSMQDKTDWRKMLKNDHEMVDLKPVIADAMLRIDPLLKSLEDHEDEEQLNINEIQIRYPVLEFPKKVTSLSLDKKTNISGTLMGIKGQYLILDTGVINIRKHAGYKVLFSCDSL